MHLLVVCDASARMSPTIDEFAHLPAGLVNLQERAFRVYPHNPPLPRLIAAAAASTQGPRMGAAELLRRQPPGSRPFYDLPNYLFLAELFCLENTQTEESTSGYLAAFHWGRRTMAVWSALTIPILFLWGRWWFGRGAGWTAACLWAGCPNLISHAGLITNDLAAASLSVVAAYAFARWLHAAVPKSDDRDSTTAALLTTPSSGRLATFSPEAGEKAAPEAVGVRPSAWRWAIVAGVVLGAALATKFSVLLLLPVFVIWAIVRAWRVQGLAALRRAGVLGPVRTRAGRQFLLLLLLALLVLNATYLFEDVGVPLDDFEFASRMLTRPRQPGDPRCQDKDVAQLAPGRINRCKGSLLGMIPCPVPAMYVVGFDRLKYEAEGKYDLYLRGQWRQQGYWDYYLYGLLVKWPLGTWIVLLLAACGVIAAIRGPILAPRPSPLAPSSTCPWLALAGVPLLVLSLLQDVNLGLRYALPAFPFLYLLAGTAAATGRPRWSRAIVVLAILFNAISVLRVHPHELAYFNEAAGGPQGGRHHLVDSNLDWGQDLSRLADWVRKHPEWSDVRLAYWGPVSPEVVGIKPYRLAPRDLGDIRKVPPAALWPGEDLRDRSTFGPQPGRFAVSANFERGMGFRTPAPLDWLARLPPGSPARHGATMLVVPRDCYRYFERFTPRMTADVGYSILLYDISLEEANRVRKELGYPEIRQD